jgi:hypothetical protein
MSQADIETLRVGYEAVRRGDWDAATHFAHPEFELQTADRVVNPGSIAAPTRSGDSSRTCLSPSRRWSLSPRSSRPKPPRSKPGESDALAAPLQSLIHCLEAGLGAVEELPR